MLQEDNLFHRITDEQARKVVKDRFRKMTAKKKTSKHGRMNEANDEEEEVDAVEQSED